MHIQTLTSNVRSPVRRKTVSPFDPMDLGASLYRSERAGRTAASVAAQSGDLAYGATTTTTTKYDTGLKFDAVVGYEFGNGWGAGRDPLPVLKERRSMDTTNACHILVVDDEPDVEPLIRQRLRRQLRSGEYTLCFASDGVAALEALSSQPEIELVVTDINMPRMDGLTLLGELAERAPDVRAIVMSAYGDIANIRTAMNRGAFDFVMKPLDFADFETTLARARRHIAGWKKVQRSRDELNAELLRTDLAGEMQQEILPVNFPETDQFDVYGEILPASSVGGDFFEVLTLEYGRIALAVADVSGTGIPAALFMMSSRTILRGAAIGRDRPCETVAEVNRLLHAENRRSMFTTLVYAVYDPETGVVRYANAGHASPIHVDAARGAHALPGMGQPPLGLDPEFSYDGESEVRLGLGDTLLLYSDGFMKSHDASADGFTGDILCRAFEGTGPRGAGEAVERAMRAVSTVTREGARVDDVTCVALHRKRA